MTKTELIACMAKETGISKSKATAFLQAFIDVLAKEVNAGESVTITGFGTFSLKETAARKGRNPGTGEAIEIAAQKSVKFSVGKALKDALNEGVSEETDEVVEEAPAKAAVTEKPQKTVKDEPAVAVTVSETVCEEIPGTGTRFCRNWWTTYWV
jgi:DNA-binding protein HU-beta